MGELGGEVNEGESRSSSVEMTPVHVLSQRTGEGKTPEYKERRRSERERDGR